MAKFIDPFTDTGFKIVFGEEDILRQFLNALFEKRSGLQPVFIQIPVFRKEAEECNDKFT